MKNMIHLIKKVIEYLYKNFPIVGGFSVNDADELTKNPEDYQYRGNSWVKKNIDKLNDDNCK